MNFDKIAKSLVTQTISPRKTEDRRDIIKDLEAANFSRAELLQEYRALYDSTEEDSIKKQILSDMSKIHQLMTPEEGGKVAPSIILNVIGDNIRVGTMLCPPNNVVEISAGAELPAPTRNGEMGSELNG
jgi:hypothetical protein